MQQDIKILMILTILLSLGIGGCASTQTHLANVRDDTGDRISVGTVQREIRIGMSGSDVISVLGSPNMVTTDAQRRETWVYDKIATERVHSVSSEQSGVIAWLFVGGSSSAGASSTSQRTLTIIIRFDEQGLVRDFAYRQSSF